jgi:hypothetical protein
MTQTRWTTEQFMSMSWHDCHVHALRVIEGEYGAGALELDLDYILEWVKCPDRMQFRIVPVTLRFNDVVRLRVTLDYDSPTAALGPFSLHGIERHTENRERYVAQVWKLVVNWPVGEITFEATGYEQRITGAEKLSELQRLLPEARYGP